MRVKEGGQSAESKGRSLEVGPEWSHGPISALVMQAAWACMGNYRHLPSAQPLGHS